MITLDDVLAAALDVQGTRPSKVPRAKLVEMYLGGKNVPTIATEVGLAPSTVRYHLEKAEVYELDPNYRHRQPQKDECVRGHDLAVHGRPRKGRPETTRECHACVRVRDQEYKARQRAKKEAESA